MSGGGVLRNAVVLGVSGLVGYAAAAQKPVPMSVQGPFIGMMSLAAVASALAHVPSVVTLGVAPFVAPLGVGILYGCGYYAGQIVHHTGKDGVFDVPPRLT
jgi:hypothetical protein